MGHREISGALPNLTACRAAADPRTATSSSPAPGPATSWSGRTPPPSRPTTRSWCAPTVRCAGTAACAATAGSPQAAPDQPARERVEQRDEIRLPLRGAALRDRYVLRLIAVDRAIHVVVLDRAGRRALDLRRARPGPPSRLPEHHERSGRRDARRVPGARPPRLLRPGLQVLADAPAHPRARPARPSRPWRRPRWWGSGSTSDGPSTSRSSPPPRSCPSRSTSSRNGVSVFKLVALIINLAVVIYLLLAKRLFGLRGGYQAEHARRERTSGWGAIERATPGVPA